MPGFSLRAMIVAATSTGTRLPSLRKYSFFIHFAGTARSDLRHGSFPWRLAIREGVSLRPSESSCGDVVSRVPDHLEEGVIGLKDLAFKIRNQYPDNIGIHKAA